MFKMTILDVSNNPNIWQLHCHFNPNLTTLYLKTGQTLQRLNIDSHTEIIYK